MAPDQGKTLNELEEEIYSWQMDVTGFGLEGQQKLKQATVMISRCGGLGGVVAYELAAAGIGRLVLAHAGNIKPSDLNRQLLMTRQAMGTSRMDSIVTRLRDLNPDLEILPVRENVSEANVDEMVSQVDVVVDAAPLFEERYAMNQAAVRFRKPLVECAMFELEGQLTVIEPGQTPCLRCLYPEPPASWKRRFPVFGAVSGSLGCMAAMEVIKLVSGLGKPLRGQLLSMDLRDPAFRRFRIRRDPACPVCRHLACGSDPSEPAVLK